MAAPDIAQTYLESLLRTERVSPQELADYQGKLLRALVRHAFEDTPFYAGRGTVPEGLTASDAFWRAQPFMSRRDLAERFDSLRPMSFPKLHGVISSLSTGGSTGPAARRDTSSLESVARLLASYRTYETWKLDQSRPFFVLRTKRNMEDRPDDSWGFPWREEARRGWRRWIDVAAPPAEQLAAMAGLGPVYVNTHPSNILRLAIEALRSGVRPDIPHIICVGEYLAPEVRELAREAFGSTVIDAFSSAEGGVIAIQCPEAGLYHIQSEQVLAEIIAADGAPCAPGGTGEVVVTPLYSYATPLLRYRSGDFVEAGPACACGRVLPTISRILGRREHMFRWPDGTRRLPEIDRVQITRLLGHEQWALAQTGEATALFRHAGSVSAATKGRLAEDLAKALGEDFALGFAAVEQLPLTSGGKRHFTFNEMPA